MENLVEFWNSLNKEFWLGQVFMIVATVLGVFLAANSGFKKALEFERLQNKRGAYLLEQALTDEVRENFINLKEWYALYEVDPGRNELNNSPESHVLDGLVFSTIAENDATTGINYKELKLISNFYRSAEPLLSDMKSGNPFAFASVQKDYKALVEQTEETLKTLDESIESQEKRLKEAGVI